VTPTVSHVASSVEVGIAKATAVRYIVCVVHLDSHLTPEPATIPSLQAPRVRLVYTVCPSCLKRTLHAHQTPRQCPLRTTRILVYHTHRSHTACPRLTRTSRTSHTFVKRTFFLFRYFCACVRGLVPAGLRVVRWHLPLHPLSRRIARCSLPTARHSRCPPVTSHHLAVGTTVSHSSVIRYA
jgi:hypothetical protein